MRIVIERNAHAQTRGNASELVFVSVATRLADIIANPGYMDGATAVGRDIIEQLDLIPGVESVWAERYRLSLEIAKAFDAAEVLTEVRAAIANTVGEDIED